MSLWNVKAHELIAAQARQLAELARESDDHLKLSPAGAKPAGHEDALRGLPVVGCEGVPGAQRGSRPGDPSRYARANATEIAA